MMHRSLLSAALIVGAFTMASALHPVAADAENPESVSAFDTADLDGDGVVTADEYRLFVIEEFFFADTNRDGQVSASDQHSWSEAPMGAVDVDNSGSVDLKELVNSSRHDFVDIDQDNNDILTRDEVEAYEIRYQ